MTSKKNVQVTLRLDNVRLSFPSLFAPDSMGDGSKPAYQADFILPPDHPQIEDIKKAMMTVAKGKWGTNWKAVLKQLQSNDKICLKSGDSKTDADGGVREGYEGNKFIRGRSYTKPTLVDKDPNVPLTEDQGKLYAGCHVNAFIAIWAQSNEFGKRINCQLQGVQFRAEGDSFGGGGKADPGVFDTLEDEFDGDDAADMSVDDIEDDTYDDDIPF